MKLIRSLLTYTLLLFVFAACSDNMSAIDEAAVAPQSKLRHGHLLDRARTGAGKGGDGLSVIVALKGGQLEKQGLLERNGLLERSGLLERNNYEKVFNGLAIDITGDVDEALAQLDADPNVLWYEPNIPMTGTTEVSNASLSLAQKLPWSIDYIGGTQSSAVSGNGYGTVGGVLVGVLDTGVSNPDVNVAFNIDVTTMLQNVLDSDGHGTHIAGIIGAYDDLDGIVGVAPGVKILSGRVEDAYGNIDEASVLEAVEYATGFKLAYPQQPVVINISLGADVGTTAYTALDEAIKASSAAGVVYVVSAGNAGTNASTYSPAHVAEAITVAAHDSRGAFASFSNYGSAVDLVAPGVDIPSLRSETLTSLKVELRSGTSMAAAHVTGAVALLLSKKPWLSPAAVHAELAAQARGGLSGVPSGTTSRSLWVGGF